MTTVAQAGEQRLARLESLRALAALAVATAHAWGLAHGYASESTQGAFSDRLIFGGGFGVFLFFALSGYLLFWPFARRDFGSGAALDLRRYALNRAVRTLPLYYVAVVVLLVVQEDGGTTEQWWRFLLLAENYSLDTVATVDGVLWSLVVEVTFYILLPFLALAIARLSGGSRARAALVLAVLGGVSLVLRIVHVAGEDPSSALWRYNLPTTFFFFVPGMLLALLRLELEERPPAWWRGAVASSGVWLAAAAVAWLALLYSWDGWLAALASFLTVGACVLPVRESRVRRALDWRPLVAVGVVSYSLYVWHTPVQVHLASIDGFPTGAVGMLLITVPLAVAAAFVSYRVIERPFLRLRRRWSAASAPIAR